MKEFTTPIDNISENKILQNGVEIGVFESNYSYTLLQIYGKNGKESFNYYMTRYKERSVVFVYLPLLDTVRAMIKEYRISIARLKSEFPNLYNAYSNNKNIDSTTLPFIVRMLDVEELPQTRQDLYKYGVKYPIPVSVLMIRFDKKYEIINSKPYQIEQDIYAILAVLSEYIFDIRREFEAMTKTFTTKKILYSVANISLFIICVGFGYWLARHYGDNIIILRIVKWFSIISFITFMTLILLRDIGHDKISIPSYLVENELIDVDMTLKQC